MTAAPEGNTLFTIDEAVCYANELINEFDLDDDYGQTGGLIAESENGVLRIVSEAWAEKFEPDEDGHFAKSSIRDYLNDYLLELDN